MNPLRITPFLIVNPFVIVWMTFMLVTVLNRDGMAVMMAGFYATSILICIALLALTGLLCDALAWFPFTLSK